MHVPRLHVVTDDARLADGRFVDDAAALLEAGGPDAVLHLRGRRTTAARLYELAIALLPVAGGSGAKLLVNDRVDVALAARTHGAHLREDSIDVARARTLLGPDALIGVSRHAQTIGQVQDAAADFVIFGTVFPTKSHPAANASGLAGLRSVASGGRRRALEPVSGSGAPAPWLVAIGGITPERVGDVLDAGADGVAAMSGVWQRGTNAVVEYIAALNAGIGQ